MLTQLAVAGPIKTGEVLTNKTRETIRTPSHNLKPLYKAKLKAT